MLLMSQMDKQFIRPKWPSLTVDDDIIIIMATTTKKKEIPKPWGRGEKKKGRGEILRIQFEYWLVGFYLGECRALSCTAALWLCPFHQQNPFSINPSHDQQINRSSFNKVHADNQGCVQTFGTRVSWLMQWGHELVYVSHQSKK